jgi:hypothetical protein
MSQSLSSGQAIGSPVGEKPQALSFWDKLLRLGARPPGAPWNPTIKYFQTRWLFFAILVLVTGATGFVIYWVMTQKIQPATVRPLTAGMDLTVVLAPVLAASAGVERSLETLFGVIEGNWRTLVAFLGRGMRWLQNAETEVESARAWLNKVSAEYTRQLQELPQFAASSAGTQAAGSTASQPGAPAGVAQDPKQIVATAQAKLQDAKELMSLAEQRLRTAEGQLSQVTDSDKYKNAKRAASIFIGLLLGLGVATAGSLQMFALMGVNVGHPRVDVIITGLVIGSGSAPVHSLINILQSAKDTLDSAQGWLESKKQPTS